MIEIIDVGASALAGESEPEYAPLLHSGAARVTGFDVQLLRRDTARERYIAAIVADGEEHIYHHYASPGLSGLLEINPVLSASDPNARCVSTERVQTRRLDDLCERCDLLKLDCQGSELLVLRNAEKLLRGTLLIQIELSFYPLYLKQPPLGAVDLFLREHDFLPHSMLHSHPMASGQWIDADFLYSRVSALCDADQESIKWEIIRRCYLPSSRFSYGSGYSQL